MNCLPFKSGEEYHPLENEFDVSHVSRSSLERSVSRNEGRFECFGQRDVGCIVGCQVLP